MGDDDTDDVAGILAEMGPPELGEERDERDSQPPGASSEVVSAAEREAARSMMDALKTGDVTEFARGLRIFREL